MLRLKRWSWSMPLKMIDREVCNACARSCWHNLSNSAWSLAEWRVWSKNMRCFNPATRAPLRFPLPQLVLPRVSFLSETGNCSANIQSFVKILAIEPLCEIYLLRMDGLKDLE